MAAKRRRSTRRPRSRATQSSNPGDRRRRLHGAERLRGQLRPAAQRGHRGADQHRRDADHDQHPPKGSRRSPATSSTRGQRDHREIQKRLGSRGRGGDLQDCAAVVSRAATRLLGGCRRGAADRQTGGGGAVGEITPVAGLLPHDPAAGRRSTGCSSPGHGEHPEVGVAIERRARARWSSSIPSKDVAVDPKEVNGDQWATSTARRWRWPIGLLRKDGRRRTSCWKINLLPSGEGTARPEQSTGGNKPPGDRRGRARSCCCSAGLFPRDAAGPGRRAQAQNPHPGARSTRSGPGSPTTRRSSTAAEIRRREEAIEQLRPRGRARCRCWWRSPAGADAARRADGRPEEVEAPAQPTPRASEQRLGSRASGSRASGRQPQREDRRRGSHERRRERVR